MYDFECYIMKNFVVYIYIYIYIGPTDHLYHYGSEVKNVTKG
jgi:hypothetical protein